MFTEEFQHIPLQEDYQQEARSIEQADATPQHPVSASTPMSQDEQGVEAPVESVQQPTADEWAVPDSFADTTGALTWYATKYQKAIDQLKAQPPIEERLQPLLQERLQEVEQEVPGFINFYKAMQVNPQVALLRFLPEAQQALGISPVLSDAQIGQAVTDQMVEEFGENYRQLFNPAEMLDPQSVSAQMQRRIFELQQYYTTLNEQSKQQLQQVEQRMLNPEIAQQTRAHAVEQGFADFQQVGMTRAQYEQFINDPSTAHKWQNLTPYDLYRLTNLDTLIAQAKEAGVQEGRKSLYNQLQKEGNAQEHTIPVSVQQLLDKQKQGQETEQRNGWGELMMSSPFINF